MSFYLPIAYHGAGCYLFRFVRYLKENGFEIEFVLLSDFNSSRALSFSVPPELRKIFKISVPDCFQIKGRFFSCCFSKACFKKSFFWFYGKLFTLLKRASRFGGNLFLPLKRGYHFIRRSSFRSRHPSNRKHLRWGYVPNRNDLAFVSKRIRKFLPDVLIADQVFMANIFDVVPSGQTCLKVLLPHDIRSQRLKSYTEHHVDFDEAAEYSQEDEIKQMNKAQLILAIHNEDAVTLKTMVPKAEVFSLPYAVEPVLCTHSQIRGRLLFVGSLVGHNIHGLEWFLREVWPKILEKVPHCVLHVCGNVCDAMECHDKRVCFCGITDDLGSEYAAAEVVVVPLLCGSGLKIKVLEALSYGRVCVSTQVGLQSLDDALGYDAVLLANHAQEFADTTVKLLMNPGLRDRIQDNAIRYIGEKYGPEKIYGPIKKRFLEWGDKKSL